MKNKPVFGSTHYHPQPQSSKSKNPWPCPPRQPDTRLGFRLVYNTNHQAQTGGCWANTADELPDCGCSDQPQGADDQAGFRIERDTP